MVPGGFEACPSWVSAHRRLFESREDLGPALAWAAETGHRWASCYSVERLLKIVADWKKATQGDSASAPKPRPKASEIIADLRQQLADAEAEFIALRDPLPAEFDVRARELAARAGGNDAAAKEELEELARHFHWRYRDLLDRETCSAPQVSKPTGEDWSDARPNTLKAEQLTSDETSARGDQGNSIEFHTLALLLRLFRPVSALLRFVRNGTQKKPVALTGPSSREPYPLTCCTKRLDKPVLIEKVNRNSKLVKSSPRNRGGADEL